MYFHSSFYHLLIVLKLYTMKFKGLRSYNNIDIFCIIPFLKMLKKSESNLTNKYNYLFSVFIHKYDFTVDYSIR